jgi:Tfp pilus assembly protein PilO
MNLRTPGATKILGALGLLMTAALSWLLVVGPATAALSDVRLGIATTREQNDVLEVQLSALNRQAAQLDETRAAAVALSAKFPPTADQPGVFREITAAAINAGIGPQDLTALTPTPPVIGGADPATGVPLEGSGAGSDLARQTVTVVVEGSYDETQRFLENLEQMPRAFLIMSISLAGASTDGAFTTTVTGDMFVMPPIEDPAATEDDSTDVGE